MARLVDLLRYKKKVQIKDSEGKVKATVWVRVLGDEDLNTAYRLARVASMQKRKLLRTEDSPEFLDEVEPVNEMTDEELISIVRQSKETEFTGEAYVNVNRDELPKIEEIAKEPDSPTLEEQEILDGKILEVETKYQKEIQSYISERLEALDAELKGMPRNEIVNIAKTALADILPLRTFSDELVAQKIFRGTYQDEACSKREFSSVEEFKESHRLIKTQLLEAYNEIELATDDIKN